MPGLPLQADLAAASQQSAAPITRPAPIGGWNPSLPANQLPPTEAAELVNWWPDADKLSVRKGSTLFATLPEAATVESFVPFHIGAKKVLLAGAGGALYRIDPAGAATALSTAFRGSDWIGDAMGGYVVLASGHDQPQKFDGVTLSDATITLDDGTDARYLTGFAAHGNRLYGWARFRQDMWYGGVGAVQGTFANFPLGNLGGIEGSVAAISNWTVDGGTDAINDLLVIVFTSGQILIYNGTDPGDPNNFALLGRYKTSAPVGKRPLVKVGPDLILTTRQGYVSLSDIRARDEVAAPTGLGAKLAPAARAAAEVASEYPGWQGVLDPGGRMLLFNYPVNGGTTYEQHAVNLATGAATRFTGLDARAWAAWDGALYFADRNGQVFRFNDGLTDNGAAIDTTVRLGWDAFDSPGAKTVAAVFPAIVADGTQDVTITLLSDYRSSGRAVVESRQVLTITQEGPFWDATPWDSDYWSERGLLRDVATASQWGERVQLLMQLTASGQVIEWMQTDWLIETASRPK
jgi:hypothetical protein